MICLPLYPLDDHERWISPSHNLGGPPLTAWFNTTKPTTKLIITDNIIDALSAAILGHQSVAALATMAAAHHTINRLDSLIRARQLELFFCCRNSATADFLETALHEHEPAQLQLPVDVDTLNGLLQNSVRS